MGGHSASLPLPHTYSLTYAVSKLKSGGKVGTVGLHGARKSAGTESRGRAPLGSQNAASEAIYCLHLNKVIIQYSTTLQTLHYTVMHALSTGYSKADITAQYTPLTRLNSTVESRRRCVQYFTMTLAKRLRCGRMHIC